MGGIKSGQRRYVNRGAVEEYPAIDLRILRRAGLVRAGECTYDTLRWRKQASNVFSARIFIDLSDPEHASVRIIVSTGDGTTKNQVDIACVPCPFGGIRCYFICPIKDVRCEQIFFADGTWASRQAQHLTYLSQTTDNLSRARRKVAKLHRQLEGDLRYPRIRGVNRWNKALLLREVNTDLRMIYRERLAKMLGANISANAPRGLSSINL